MTSIGNMSGTIDNNDAKNMISDFLFDSNIMQSKENFLKTLRHPFYW